MKYDIDNIIGRKFGRLFVTGPEIRLRGEDGHVDRYIYCNCDCGNNHVLINLNKLMSGDAKSCGCLNEETRMSLGEGRHNGTIFSLGNTKHGDSKRGEFKQLYSKWKNMMHKETIGLYEVCPEWNTYENFKAWAISAGWNSKDNPTLKCVNIPRHFYPDNCIFINK